MLPWVPIQTLEGIILPCWWVFNFGVISLILRLTFFPYCFCSWQLFLKLGFVIGSGVLVLLLQVGNMHLFTGHTVSSLDVMTAWTYPTRNRKLNLQVICITLILT